MLADHGSAVDIIYLDAYKRMRLIKSDLSPTTAHLYRFIKDHVIPKGMIKLAVTVGEYPRVSTVVIEFLVMDYSSAFNGVIGRSILKTLKVVTSIYHLTMKFLTAKGTEQVRRSQYNRGNGITSHSCLSKRRRSYLK